MRKRRLARFLLVPLWSPSKKRKRRGEAGGGEAKPKPEGETGEGEETREDPRPSALMKPLFSARRLRLKCLHCAMLRRAVVARLCDITGRFRAS